MKIDLGISLINGDGSRDVRYIHITRQDVIKRIKNHPSIDPWTKDFLFKRINDYPDDALIYFVNNINQIVITALNERERILKEQNAIDDKEIDSDKTNEQQFENLKGSIGGINEDENQESKDQEREDFFSKNTIG